MRRPTSIEPFTPSPTVTLHPLMQSVLDNLDIQIDEELTRYRRQRRYPNPAGGSTARKPLSSSAHLATNSAAQADGSAKSFDLKFASAQSTNASPSSTAIGILNHTIQRPTPRASLYADAPLPEHFPASEAKLSESISQLAAEQAAVLNNSRRSVEPPTAPVSDLEPSARISSYAEQNDLSVYAPNETLQKLMQQAEAQSDRVPEDYLASSEELLRSIAEEDVDLRAEREPNSMLETLLTPLGIGSMLLLLLSSTTLGYVIMNPSSLGWWTASQPQSSPTAAGTGSATAPSPDLASEEFVDLGLDTLSTLPKPPVRGNSTAAKAKPSATASNKTASNQASSQAASRSANPAPVVLESIPVAPVPQPSLSTVVVPSEPPIVADPDPEPVYQPAPLPAPAVLPEPINATPPVLEPAPAAVTAAAPISPAALSPESYYYVVTDYSGDASLQEARGAVPDAYVRNLPAEGAKVQLGAFSDEAKAQELLQELENQGIQAEMYQP